MFSGVLPEGTRRVICRRQLCVGDFQTLSSGGSPSVYFDADVMGPNGKTGPVGANTFTPSVPEPSAIALFATGLIGAALSIRRRSMFSK